MELIHDNDTKYGFNSMIVRLKEYRGVYPHRLQAQFQFYDSPIKSFESYLYSKLSA